MRTFGKILGVIAIVVLVLVVVLVSFGAWTVHRSFPQLDGAVEVPGLTGSVEVIRDDRGVPQIYADNLDDLFFAQGYVHAQDRFWEMDVRRHITAGRMSEMFGDSQVDTDKFLRTVGWRRVAEQEYPMLSPETKQILEAYANGVNAYIGDRSGAELSLEYSVLRLINSEYQIEPWGPVDSIAWLKALAWDLGGNMSDEIQRSLAAAKVGVDRAEEIYPPYPYARHRPIVARGTVVDGRVRPERRGATRPEGRGRTDGRAGADRHPSGFPAPRRCARSQGRGDRLQQLGGLRIQDHHRQTAAGQRSASRRRHALLVVPGRPALPHGHAGLPLRCGRLDDVRHAGGSDRAQRRHRVGFHQPRPGRHGPGAGEGRRRQL